MSRQQAVSLVEYNLARGLGATSFDRMDFWIEVAAQAIREIERTINETGVEPIHSGQTILDVESSGQV